MSHLACDHEPKISFTTSQVARFERARRIFAGVRAGLRTPLTWYDHLEASAGAVLMPESRYGCVRVGLALYGAGEHARQLGCHAAMGVASRIVALRHIGAGERVGYGGAYSARQPTTIATVPLGYADGVPRALFPGGSMLVHGRRVTIAGAVSMDLLGLDVGPLPACAVGDDVVALGEQGDLEVSAGDWARQANTIAYDILTGFSSRLPRTLVGSEVGTQVRPEKEGERDERKA